MIKNKKDLLKGLPNNLQKKRKILLDIVDYTLLNISPEKLLKKELKKSDLKDFKKILVISIGKAAKGMAEAIKPILKGAKFEILLADKGHPLPTNEGLKNTQKIIEEAKKLTKDDLAIVLISGGGSSMLVSPVYKISLEDKIKTTKKLLKCGAKINEINAVRKHLSLVKGGGLAELIYPAKTYGFVISDVIGNNLSVIASGPISPDETTFSDVFEIIKKYKINLPKSVKNYLEKGLQNKTLETPKSHEEYFKHVKIKIIADHKTVTKLASEKAKTMSIKTKILKQEIEGEARIEAKKFVKQSHSKTLLIASGETTVTCRGHGLGGRNQEFVLSALPYLMVVPPKRNGLNHMGTSCLKENLTILSIGTDGVDGICPQKIAGVVADSSTQKSAKQKHLSIEKYLKNNDSYNFFKSLNCHIITGETGTNLGDLMMIY